MRTEVLEKINLRQFFKTEIPEKLDSFVCLEFLDNSRVKEILPEREPQLYIDRAVFGNIDHAKVVIGLTHVTSEICRGHFEWCPIVPLSILAQCAGQAGALLINLVASNTIKIPLAVHVKNVKSISDKTRFPRKNFVMPGNKVLFIAIYEGKKFNFYKATVEIYVEGAIIGKLEKIGYILVEREYIINDLKGGDF